jgi:hypothetical protein
MGVWFGNASPAAAKTLEPAPVADSGFGLLDSELGNDSLETDPLLANDPLLADDPLASWGSSDESATSPTQTDWAAELAARYDAAKTQSFGGWYRDDLTMSIRYRGKGHSDAVLQSMIEVIQRLPADDPLRKTMLAQPAVQACAECHQVNAQSGSDSGLASMRWRAFQTKTNEERLTHFSHTPHLNIQGLQDCQHCHQLGTTNPANAVHMDGESPVELSPEFLPMTKANCASCHTKSAAGDHCTRCHRYHVHDVP